MDTLGAYVPYFCSVLLVKYALHSQRPGFRVRKLLYRRKEVCRSSTLISNRGERLQARTSSGRQATIGQECRVRPVATACAIHALQNIASATELRRNRQKAQVVIQHVIGHSKAATDGGVDRKSTRLNSSHVPLSRMPS